MPAVNGVGKPCAGEPHARFDGRELETAHRSHQGHGDEGHQGKPCGHQRLRDLPSMRVTAPALDPPTTALRWSPHESSQVAHTHQRDSAPARPSTDSTRGGPTSTASTSAWHPQEWSPTSRRSALRSAHRPPPEAFPAAARRAVHRSAAQQSDYATASPSTARFPSGQPGRNLTHHLRPPTQFATATPTLQHLFDAEPTPPTRHVQHRSTRSRQPADWAQPSLPTGP